MAVMRFDEIRGFVRLASGLRQFLKERISIENAPDMIRARVADRDSRFLAKLGSAVFANRHSPYRTLCDWAGVEFGDIGAMVRTDGLEAALIKMRDAGIYVAWEEFKCRKPIIRGSQTLEVSWWAFNNPVSRTDFEASTGGSSGQSLRVAVDLDNDTEAAPDWANLFNAHRWHDNPLLFWTPNHVGVSTRFIKCSKFGKDMERWFVMARMTDPAEKVRSTLIHGLIRTVAGYPKPVDAPLAKPERVLDDLYDWLDKGERPVMNTSPSAAAALGQLALQRGRPLEGVSFLLGAEPVTPARFRTIADAKALPVATYGTSEAGWIGARFPGGGEADEVHLFKDAFAVIPNTGDSVEGGVGDPLLFTNLRAAAPKVLLNTEIGDTAVIVRDKNDHWAKALGYDTRLHTVRSYRKVTVWGTTFAVADLGDLIEVFLPEKFGGSHADYQLWEDEDDKGRPSLRLLIDPSVGPLDEQKVNASFLEEITNRGRTYGFMVEEIRSMNGLVIERRRPKTTARGKLLSVMTGRKK